MGQQRGPRLLLATAVTIPNSPFGWPPWTGGGEACGSDRGADNR